MDALRVLKVVAVAMGIVIIVLLGVLFFYNPAQAPPLPPDNVGGAKIDSLTPIVSSDNHVTVMSLHANDVVSSPLTVTGSVVDGGWFFEGSFPVKVLDGDGTVIGQGVAQAQADWESTGTVPFTAVIQFTAPRYATGTVVLSKDNPSGAAANALSFSIPVQFQ